MRWYQEIVQYLCSQLLIVSSYSICTHNYLVVKATIEQLNYKKFQSA